MLREFTFVLLIAVLAFHLMCKKEPRGEVREVIFEVYPGESALRIAERLDSLEVISHPRRFVMKAKFRGADRRLQSGVYRLHTCMSEDSVLFVLSKGEVATITVTVPEGFKLTEIASRLAGAGVVNQDTFLALCRDKRLLSEFNIPFGSFEGLLFPDTYGFPLDILPEDVLRVMAGRFFEVTEPYLRETSLDTLVILASIVEREAYLDEERPIIASIFWNRLRKGMPLESCATIEYALPEHKERLTFADLRIDSPYNTYINTGLPPGPICSPGKTSLEAVARPKETKYLYFVSKGDGSHHFSETASEHERMKRKINKERSRNGA